MTEPALAPPPPPPPPPPPGPTRACAECGATLDERQEICVECGHDVTTDERRRVRGALPTASLAAFAVLLAASAAYGLSAGGASNVRDLGVGQSKPPGSSTVAQATPTPPPATTTPAPDTVPQATPTPPPASSSSSPSPKASKPAAKAKTPSTTSSTPSTSGGTTPSNPTSTPRRHHTVKPPRRHTPKPPPSWVADGDPPFEAKNYNGGSRPAKAIDGSTKTAWMTRSTGVGIVVDTGEAQPYSEVGIVTSTPGFSVAVYSNTDNSGSGDPSANGWKLENRSSVAKYQTIRIKPRQKRYLLIYVTKLPQSKAAINEIKLIL